LPARPAKYAVKKRKVLPACPQSIFISELELEFEPELEIEFESELELETELEPEPERELKPELEEANSSA
jgi:hypothetical protein